MAEIVHPASTEPVRLKLTWAQARELPQKAAHTQDCMRSSVKTKTSAGCEEVQTGREGGVLSKKGERMTGMLGVLS